MNQDDFKNRSQKLQTSPAHRKHIAAESSFKTCQFESFCPKQKRVWITRQLLLKTIRNKTSGLTRIQKDKSFANVCYAYPVNLYHRRRVLKPQEMWTTYRSMVTTEYMAWSRRTSWDKNFAGFLKHEFLVVSERNQVPKCVKPKPNSLCLLF